MNKNDLEKKLFEKGIPHDAYTLMGGFPNERFCLNEDHGNWEVYYSEHGLKTQLKRFHLENDACEYLYNQLLKVFGKG